jgi:hypothetical protein
MRRRRNVGYVQRILRDYWPATNLPDVPSTNPTVINRQRSGAVAMAIHYFTDGVVMPPPFTVTTHASSNVTTAGTSIFDLVTVSGLLPGRSIIVTSTVYGPLPPGSDGTCSGIDWEAADLPIAARLAIRCP